MEDLYFQSVRYTHTMVLVWDNHPIHQRRLVQDFIESEPRLHVYVFPTCAPDLNPMEFVWTHASHATENFAPHTSVEFSTRVWSAIAKVRSSNYS